MHISLFGCIFGCQFSNTPNYEYQKKHHFRTGKPEENGVPITENVPIRMRVIFASQRIEFTTGYRIDATKWDTDKQRVKNGCTNKLKLSASEINADLLRQYTEIQNIFKEFEVQNVLPTPAQIKDSFNARMKDAPVTEQETAEGPKISFGRRSRSL